MGDTYSRVQEGKEVADYKELTSLVLEIEIFAIWKRHEKSSQRLHVCKEVETKEFAKNWLGKVRELKSMIHEFKGNQMKVIKSNNIIIADNLKLKEQMNRIESVLTGLKEKLVDSTEESSNQINCPNGHKIMFSSFYENFTVCTKCKKNCEVGYNCNLCSYSICRSCYKISFKEKFGKHDITCFRNHKLTWTTDHSFYQNYDKKVFNCTGCKKKMFKDSYNCKVCKWDICFKCVDIICSKALSAWSVLCEANHSLSWNPRPHGHSYRCNKCSQNFMKAGSFRCQICDYDLCIRCLDSLV